MRPLMPWRGKVGRFLEPFRQEMEDLFDRFFGEPIEVTGTAVKPWAPRMDIEETDQAILVKADLPGVDPKDVDVAVADGSLILRGEKKGEKEEKGKLFHRTERFLGRFYRALPLPLEADFEKVVATGAKGVLTITIPKKPEKLPRKVELKDEGDAPPEGR